MLKRSIIAVHRWLGVALCLFFLVWFPSGIGMMYWDFPSVDAADRLARSPALDPATIHLSPAEALAISGLTPQLSQARLNTFAGRPIYRFRTADAASLVYADTGAPQAGVAPEIVDSIASRWVGQPAGAATRETLDEADQWTVQRSFRVDRTLLKYSWPNGEQVYVSPGSGEVVQYTTTASRLGAYLGPIPHWLYFTPLRRHQEAWNQVVTWSSGVGTVAAALGLVIGVWMYSPTRRYRYDGAPARLPYRGQKRWHAVLGLIFGVGAVTWAFSGMLSMDPVPALRERPRADIPRALHAPLQLPVFAARDPRSALALLPDRAVKELEFVTVGGESVYLATLDGGRTRIVPVNAPPRDRFDARSLVRVIEAASQPDGLADSHLLDHYDVYYLDRHRQRPLPVILAQVNDAQRTRYYIDPRTARVVGSYSARSWMSRWLYHGLHSLDFPWLYDHRPLWDIVIITFMAGGTALGVTSLVLAWRVVGAWLMTSSTR